MDNNKYVILPLLFILILSVALHLYRLDFPNQPVFDEVYFATYSANYVKRIPFENNHPPLGKIIYAAALSLYGESELRDSEFIKVQYDKETKENKAITYPEKKYGDFPYLVLRMISAFFGIILPIIFYFFLRTVGLSNIGALLGAFAVSLENAILVDTRFILLNGMYLVFGVTALTLYFKKVGWPIASGVMMGMALGVKLVAFVFLGPIIIYHYIKSRDLGFKKDQTISLIKFGVAAFLVLFVIISTTNLFFSPLERYKLLSSHNAVPENPLELSPYLSNFNTFRAYLIVSFIEGAVSLSNYVYGPTNHPYASSWYLWPAMQVPVLYYTYGALPQVYKIGLFGNPVVWYLGTLAIVFAIAIARRFIRKKFAEIYRPKRKIFFLLFGGYIAALLPFATIVYRSTYIYHYFPALLFSIGLLAWFISEKFHLENLDSITKKQKVVLVTSVALFVFGFLWNVRNVYGL